MEKIYKKEVLIGVLLVLMLVGGIFLLKGCTDYDTIDGELAVVDAKPSIAVTTEEKSDNEKIWVEVKGEVVNPGVYELTSDKRIQDLITAAGGFKDSAYFDNINLSKKIKDEMVIFVYSKTAMKKLLATQTTKKETVSVTNKECVVTTYDIGECTNNKESVIVTNEESKTSNISASNESSNKETTSKETSETTSNNGLVNINTAGVKELTTLDGIGESKAQKIIAYREENGAFKSIEDIKNVSGIGATTYEKFKENITI